MHTIRKVQLVCCQISPTASYIHNDTLIRKDLSAAQQKLTFDCDYIERSAKIISKTRPLYRDIVNFGRYLNLTLDWHMWKLRLYPEIRNRVVSIKSAK